MTDYKSYPDYLALLGPSSPFFLDHVSRYWWAARFAEGKTVLDCACGQGYGSFILAQSARSVLGIDLNTETLNAAKETFVRYNLEFKQYDALKLSESGLKFDLITAFEMIEHIPPDTTDLFLGSFASALAPGGVLMISTPNHDVVLKSGTVVPEFHVNNFRPAELKKVLSKHFEDVKMLGQFKRRKGLAGFLFSLDYLNLRHSLNRILRKYTEKSTSQPDGHSDDVLRTVASGRLEPSHYLAPYPGCDAYAFDQGHWRQAGLIVAICRNPKN